MVSSTLLFSFGIQSLLEEIHKNALAAAGTIESSADVDVWEDYLAVNDAAVCKG